jgi:nucleoside-diphosphate-sugar epimerase
MGDSSTPSASGSSAAPPRAAVPLRVVVTGGSGRVGTWVIRELVARGHTVVNADRRAPSKPVDGVRWAYADLAHREQVQPLFEAADAVCHLGEIPTHHAPMPPDEIYATNCRIGSVVLQTAADLKLKRFVYTSTCQTYGFWDTPPVPPLRLPFDESHPLQPQNVYALSKAANERYARYVAERHGLSVAALRLPWVMTHDEFQGDTVGWVKSKIGPTDGLETFLHGADAARGFALALEHPRPGFEPYHLTAPDVISFRPLARRLAEHHPNYPTLPTDWPPYKSPAILDKAKAHFGWEPRVSFRERMRAKIGGELPEV